MINITTDIEAILTQFARAIPDLYLDFDREAIQVVESGFGVFDIVLVLSEDEELVLGEMVLSADFDLTYEIFED
jgi:hypothetical protein